MTPAMSSAAAARREASEVPLGLPAEQAFDQGLSAQAEVLSDVAEDAGQRADPEGRVTRDGDVVLTAFESGQPKMAAGLTSHPIA